MLYLGVTLLGLSLVGIPICILILLIRACMRKPLKKTAMKTGIFMTGLCVGFMMIVLSPDPDAQDAADEESARNYDYAESEDWYLGSVKADEFYESENDSYYVDDEDAVGDEWDYYSESKKSKYSIEDMEQAVFHISEYPYQNKSKVKKLMETYEKAMKAPMKDFIYVEEKSKGGLFSETEIYYKKTVDIEAAAYKYYGKVNKAGEPKGTGILLEKWTDENEDFGDISVHIYYIGGFHNGRKDGYGIQYGELLELQDQQCLEYEGEFKEGRYDGKGTAYIGSKVESEIIYEFEQMKFSNSDAYNNFYEKKGNQLKAYPVWLSGKNYEGDFKDGKRDGYGEEYWGHDENGKEILHYKGDFEKDSYDGDGISYFDNGNVMYKGKFKNGDYDGKGTLYDEEGNIVHKGKFRNGDVL